MRMLVAVAVASFALSCSNKCSSENCDGCCDASGTCKLGNSNSACGTNGAECNSCTFGQSCVANACFGNIGGGGAGGGSGFTGGGSGFTEGGTGITGGSSGGGTGLPSGAWVKQFGTNAYDLALDVAFDSSGNVYMVGSSLTDFTGPTTITGTLRKFDGSGTLLWSKSLDGIYLTRVLVDGSGVYVVGGHSSSSPISYDAFLRKYDAQGVELWTRESGVAQVSDSFSVATFDSTGSVLAAGISAETNDGGLGAIKAAFVKYSASGALQDSRTLDAGFFSSLSLAPDGRLLMASFGSTGGYSVSAYDLDTGIEWSAHPVGADGGSAPINAVTWGGTNQSFATTYFLSPDGGFDNQLFEIDGTGTVVSRKSLGDTTAARLVFDDASNTLWVVGTAQGEAVVTSFVAGVQQSTQRFGTSGGEAAYGVAATSGALCTSGYTNGAFPGFTNAGLPDGGAGGAIDAFIACWPR